MSESIISIEDAAARLAEVVARVEAERAATVILKSGRPVARIVPIPVYGESSDDLVAFLRHWRSEYPGPDEPLAQDIEESRRAVLPPHNPWE